MRILMLGPLGIEGDEVGAVTAAKHRSLLAVLLISANRVVSVSRLIHELWERPPSSAENLVRQYVSHLRKLLAAARPAGVEVRTHAAGYVLTVPKGATDVEDFERLVQLGRRHLGEGQPVQARTAFAQALDLWRGEAFADVLSGPSVAAERARLEELRVDAQELGAAASIDAGQLTEAISQLRVLTIHYPLREGPHASLMRTLSAVGRKAEALAAYRAARETLVAELGLEPSRELCGLARAILADEVPEYAIVPGAMPHTTLA